MKPSEGGEDGTTMGAGFCKELLHGLGSLDDIAFLRKRTKLSASCRKCQSAGSGQLIFFKKPGRLTTLRSFRAKGWRWS